MVHRVIASVARQSGFHVDFENGFGIFGAGLLRRRPILAMK
jgi:hypothetical protein